MIKYKVKQDSTLLLTLLEVYKGASKQKVKQIIQHSKIIVNGKTASKLPNSELKKDDLLELVKLEKNIKTNVKPTRSKPIAIYYEDQYYLVALKPAGILSCGDKTGRSGNSYHKLLESFISQRDDIKTLLWVVHRIDREVEGLLIFAKSEEYQYKLKENWDEVTKKYLALTEGKPENENGIIESWLRDGEKQYVSSFKKQVEGSKFAKTQYKYLRPEGKYHLLEILLHTGRKNQIRVHLSDARCPIVGDRKYGADKKFVRQIRLSAFYLEFNHPFTNNPVVVKYYPSGWFFKPSEDSDEQYKIL